MDFSKEPVRSVPKYKEQRYNRRRKKKLETFKGVKIPPKRVRGNIAKKDYEKAVELFGSCCVVCGNPYIEMHHICFRSQGGRGNYRNLTPLCKDHHNHAHQLRSFADQLREERKRRFGQWYWADKFDLFKKNIIPNCTDESFEKFMREEEERCQQDG